MTEQQNVVTPETIEKIMQLMHKYKCERFKISSMELDMSSMAFVEPEPVGKAVFGSQEDLEYQAI